MRAQALTLVPASLLLNVQDWEIGENHRVTETQKEPRKDRLLSLFLSVSLSLCGESVVLISCGLILTCSILFWIISVVENLVLDERYVMTSPRNIARILLLVVSSLFILSFAADAQETNRKLRFDTVAKHFSSGHWEKMNYVIMSKDEWDRVWALAMSNTYPLPPAPEIDFSKRSVIAVFQGFQPSDGYSVSITKIVRSDGAIKVTVRESMPADSCHVLMVVTEPYHIIELDRVEDANAVTFKIKKEIRDCQ